MKVDVVVIGAGPGGYVAAIRAAQLGFNTVCIEKSHLGGICLNWGCIPTKALLRSAEYVRFLKHSNEFGFDIPDYKVDFNKVIQRSRDVANRMSQGIAFLFKKYKVQHITGSGYINDCNTVEVRNETDELIKTITTKNIVIATGSSPRMFPTIEVDRQKIITSREAMVQKEIPKSLVVIGAGAIGVEFSYFYNVFGTQVTLIEMQDRILPIEDVEISKELERNYRKEKIRMLTNTKVLSAKRNNDNVEVIVQKKDGTNESIITDLCLNAVGVYANIENIGLENINVEPEHGFLKTDENLSIAPNVYAIGDIAGPPWLAHKASAEGISVAEIIAGHKRSINYANTPGCTYCNPQVASVGLNEEKAVTAGYKVKIGKFPFTASGKAHAMGETTGFVKLIFNEKNLELLGAHLIGPEVTELLGELCIALEKKLTAHDIIRTMHAHPSLCEAIMEAAAAALGEVVNS